MQSPKPVYGRLACQIEERVHGKEVMVEERMDGSLCITYDNRILRFKEITSRPVREEPKGVKAKTKTAYIPPKDHPWKKYPVINRHHHEEVKQSLFTKLSK